MRIKTFQTGIKSFLLALACLHGVLAYAGVSGPAFSKNFSPNTIGPGSTTTLNFVIDNSAGAAGATALAFTDSLPAGVTIATPAFAISDCGGTLTAPDGGGTITQSGGTLGAGAVCSISVNVSSSTPGTHANLTGNLTSNLGNGGSAGANLTVITSRPGFSKSFAPSAVNLGARSTLTFTIDNSANPSFSFNLAFSDTLPAGMLLASPANAVNDCGAITILAVPGTSVVALEAAAGGSIMAMASCTISVDVMANNIGVLDNLSGELSSFSGFSFATSGMATASLDVTAETVHIAKNFVDDPTPPGGTTTLDFTISNFDRSLVATGVGFSDDLSAVLSGLVGTGLPVSACGGTLVGTAGNTLLTFSGGNLAAGTACTISVALTVPPAATPGNYANITSGLSGSLGGTPFSNAAASDSLFISTAPILTKTFTNDPVAAGSTVDLEFTVTNTSSTSAATNITFSDELTTLLPFPIMATLPATPCGPGSTLALTSPSLERHVISLNGGNLAIAGMAGDSCTFITTIDIPVDVATGNYVNTTSPVRATVDGMTQIGASASDTLTVIQAPRLVKEFTNNPVDPGGTATLQFSLSHDMVSVSNADNITFTDDLAAMLTGVTAVGLPLNDLCGPGNGSLVASVGDTLLTFSGASLAPGASCVFSVNLSVPVGAPSGLHSNTTSPVSATVSSIAAMSSPGMDDLYITSLTFVKSFLGNPVLPGELTTLRFTLANTSTVDDASNIVFTDDLNAVLAGLAVGGALPTTPCGLGSSITGTNFLILLGGDLVAGATCTFDVPVLIPAAAADGTYPNVTSPLTATIGIGSVTLLPATADLVVDATRLQLTKSFTDDPVDLGANVNLQFTLTNLDPVNAATAITFIDDLDAALTGLVAVTLPPAGMACNGSATLSGASVLTFSGGSLAAGASCTFSAGLQVPAVAALGGGVINTTSGVTGTINATAVTGDPATDPLLINFLNFSKSFDAATTANGTPVLSFIIGNLSTTDTATSMGFTDDLNAVLAGLVATGTPFPVCGGTLSGTTTLSFSNGSLAPNAACTINVNLQVPAGATPGTYLNTTSSLSLAGIAAANPALAMLVVEPPPLFAKAFSPTTTANGQPSTLSFIIDNTASSVAANNMSFVDMLPAGLNVAATPNVASTCGGTVSATAGGTMVSFSTGSVAGGASCIVMADVSSTIAGAYVNTSGDLTSSSGNSGTATATLTVLGPPEIEVSGNAMAIADGDTTPNLADGTDFGVVAYAGMQTSTFTIDNLGTGDLGISGVSLSGPDVADYVVTTMPAATVLPGNNTSFDIQFLPVTAGAKQAVVNIASDDADENPYDFAITGFAEDNDGVPAAVEDQVTGPGVVTMGDGNNDGIADGIQDNVTSLPTATGAGFMTLEVDPGCGLLQSVAAVNPTSLPPLAATVFSFGLVEFVLPCEMANVDVTFHESTGFSRERYFKYGPITPGDPGTTDWYDFGTYATASGNTWSLSLADDRLGDDTGDDGIIFDQGGPGLMILMVPALSKFSLLWLTMAMLLMGWYVLRRKPDPE